MNQTDTSTASSPQPAWWIPIGFLILLLPGIRTISHSGFWVHLASGQAGFSRSDPLTRVAEGTTWVNTNWLYDLLLVRLWSLGGPAIVTLLHVLAVGIAFFLLARLLRSQVSAAAVALSLCVGGWLLAPQFIVDPGTFSLLFGAIAVVVLSASIAPTVKTFAILIPLQIVWANIHVSFLWGPVLAFLFTLQAFFDQPAGQRRMAAALPGAGLTLALLVASLVNPYGPALFGSVTSLPAASLSSEWISPVSGLFPSTVARHMVILALLVGAGGLLTRKQRLPLALTAVAMISAFITVRSTPAGIRWFALLAFPFLGLSFEALGDLIRKSISPIARFASLGISVTLAALALLSTAALASNRYYLSTGSFSTFGIGANQSLFPENALAILRHDEFPERMVNLPLDGGYLAFALPERRVFIDGRSELHDPAVTAILATALSGQEQAWTRFMADHEPEAIILSTLWTGTPDAVRHLSALPDWDMIFFDGISVVLIRDLNRYPALADHWDLWMQAGKTALANHRRDIRQQVENRFRVPGLSAPLLGAARMYMASNQFREAAACYALLAAQAPGMATARLNLGVSLRHLGEHEAAVRTLEQALDSLSRDSSEWLTAHMNMGISQLALSEPARAIRHLRIVNQAVPDNILSWLYLSRAYAQVGQSTDARQAIERAYSLNPGLTEQFLRSDM